MQRQIDPSAYPRTLNADRISRLPVYKMPRTYYAGSPGMGCFMDPPGYPTYYVQPVYNSHGNTPRNAPDAVIMGPDGEYRRLDRVYVKSDDRQAASKETDRRWAKLIRSLWAPLPLDHARTVAWIRVGFGYFRGGWLPSVGSRNAADPEFIGRDAHEIRALVAGTFWTGQSIKPPRDVRTYRPVDHVLEYYPDADPVAVFNDHVDYGAYGKAGDWWTTASERPTPETCPGMVAAHGSTWPTHAEAKGACQWCGYPS